jgi:ssDNA thymidine ADP-ribosyltransferase, DarT
MNELTVADALGRLQVTRLAHFTPARNIWHIVEDGTIHSSKDLAERFPEYFSPTDRQRFDSNPDKVCCSFEYPNGYYLAQAKANPEYQNYREWICLLLDADLLLTPGTLFCGCNAAKGGGCYVASGGQALLDCYADPSRPGGWPRRRRHHPGAATDLQAEALIPGPISLSHLRGIVVRSAEVAQELCGDLRTFGHAPDRYRWIVAPLFFEKMTLSQRVRYGGVIEETVWTPTVDQGRN